MSDWSLDKARELYGIERWGNSYFKLNEAGEVVVSLRDGHTLREVSLLSMAQEMQERGWAFPIIFRFHDLLDRRIETLNESFRQAIAQTGYQGSYRGVYPIKVNQQQQVVAEVTEFGKRYHFGLEAGSKAELIAALSNLHDREAYLICNGYKDHEFIDLALRASLTGLQIILVLEMPTELHAILQRSRHLGIRPVLGIRFRLSTQSEGHWAESGGDRSVFGLNTAQVLDVVDTLRQEGYLDCLQLFHYHQGSQLPNIRAIREAANEAVRVYVNLLQEGAPMGILDMGGGLAVDYDGSHGNLASSCNYSLTEYATDLVEIVQEVCDQASVPHPTLITESGRAIVAYYSVLVFNILDVTHVSHHQHPPEPEPDRHAMLHNLWEVSERLSTQNILECFNDALFYRDKVRSLFNYGVVNLRDRALAERLYWHLMTRIAALTPQLDYIPEELQNLEQYLTDFYYGNFSVFQSLPDSWAIRQIFPIMPLNRHHEQPTERAVLADITCDCDGKIDQFIDSTGVRRQLPIHPPKEGEETLVGCFLVGAYQETLGDLHNLLGDPNVVSVGIRDSAISFTRELEGDTVSDVLSYVEYNPKEMESHFRAFAEQAVQEGRMTGKQRRELLTAYRETMNGYTYYEQ